MCLELITINDHAFSRLAYVLITQNLFGIWNALSTITVNIINRILFAFKVQHSPKEENNMKIGSSNYNALKEDSLIRGNEVHRKNKNEERTYEL